MSMVSKIKSFLYFSQNYFRTFIGHITITIFDFCLFILHLSPYWKILDKLRCIYHIKHNRKHIPVFWGKKCRSLKFSRSQKNYILGLTKAIFVVAFKGRNNEKGHQPYGKFCAIPIIIIIKNNLQSELHWQNFSQKF